ncbi:hydroxymethylglutaryl-CoA reductase [Candidatus Daviesbacteria bacterium]|nr:hydroxymethylglutaryl-CoA reductase [Candidatus Daviesbacteria bacterium]
MANRLRDFKNAFERRVYLENKVKIHLDKISNFSFPEEEVLGRNIENLIGATQIPLGIAGPILIKGKGEREKGKGYFIPLATTEGALVASVSRGCKAISESGGTFVEVENVGITRGPVFRTEGIEHSVKVKTWVDKNFLKITHVAKKTSSHLKLKKLGTRFAGRNLFIRFYFNTQDAMGMNMATIATEAATKLIEKETGAECISVAGNFDIDKKPAWLNFISGRGKRVWAEVTLKKALVKEVLKTTPEKIADLVYRKCLVGSIMSGSLGFNAHFANIIAALFIATGQDPAHIAEGSLGITTAEVLDDGSLHFSIYLPSLIVGIIGGGTTLPTQKEALNITGANSVLEFAEVIAGAVLAGELSLLASQAEGTLASSHIKLGRKGKK